MPNESYDYENRDEKDQSESLDDSRGQGVYMDIRSLKTKPKKE